MSRLHQGDHEAIAALFKRYSSAIYRVGEKMLRDSGEADDLVQEVFSYVYLGVNCSIPLKARPVLGYSR